MAIKVREEFERHEMLIATVNGKRVNLKGTPVRYDVDATLQSPKKTVEIPAATAQDLLDAFKNGEPCLFEDNSSNIRTAPTEQVVKTN